MIEKLTYKEALIFYHNEFQKKLAAFEIDIEFYKLMGEHAVVQEVPERSNLGNNLITTKKIRVKDVLPSMEKARTELKERLNLVEKLLNNL